MLPCSPSLTAPLHLPTRARAPSSRALYCSPATANCRKRASVSSKSLSVNCTAKAPVLSCKLRTRFVPGIGITSLPALTSSDMAPTVSSIGILGSTRCFRGDRVKAWGGAEPRNRFKSGRALKARWKTARLKSIPGAPRNCSNISG
jgi:hypothetical protein